MFRVLTTTTLLAFVTTAAMADNRALILGNADYRLAGDIRGAPAALRAETALRRAGFTVITGADLPTEGLRAALGELLSDRDSAERIIILLSGHFAKSERGTWFLGTEASRTDLATVDGQGLPLATVLEIASGAPGGAIVLLGTEPQRITLGTGLAPGIGVLDIPQGVTVLSGDATEIADFAMTDLVVPGRSIAALAASRQQLRAEGFLGALNPFLGTAAAPVRPTEPATPAGPSEAERAFWQVTRGLATVAAYESYLTRYPNGTFAALARAEVARQQAAEPGRIAEDAERALNLSRDQRRAIQRNLGVLGFDPRGIDGVFGAGSRTAIKAWQRANKLEQTGFLTRDQISRLTRQGEARAAELEAEAEAKRIDEERRDRAYWQETGAVGDEAGLRAYLKRYPDGFYSELANERLAVIEEDRRQAAAAKDRAAWDKARAADTITSYRAYMTEFPRGAFMPDARDRIAALTTEEEGAGDRQAAERAEAALNLPVVAKRMVELRLDQMGFDPGSVDGTFDNDTRRAIRRFQRVRGMPETGYLTEAAVVQLLSGGIIQFGD